MNMAGPDTADKAAIIAVIEEESAAWLRGDIEGWTACWVQDAHTEHVTARLSAGAWVLRGFNEIAEFFDPDFRDHADRQLTDQEIRRDNWQITVGVDMAWATFDQVRSADAIPSAGPGRHFQMRILEKVEGRWKIAALFQIPNRYGFYKSRWVQVDRTGRVIQMGPGADDYLREHGALHLVGQRLTARRAPARARLQAALAEVDDCLSRRVRHAPIPLVMSEVGDDAISLCWVTITDMMIVVLLGDDSLLPDAIARAGTVYGLSRAQLRVAEAIARGKDLTEVARELRVKPNTVRTHVRRMFDRVEVNSQPALIRALLSVDATRL